NTGDQMNLFAWLWNRLRHFRTDADIEEELRVHASMLAEDHRDAGASSGEADRRAHLQLGEPLVVVEKVRDQEFLTFLEGWYRDFKFGLRALRKNPVFCLTAILTLAFGIGANTAIFTLLYGLLLRSLPVPNPQELARVSLTSPAARSAAFSSIPYQM